MYTTFFNLKCKPFELVPDPEFLLMSRVHKRALIYLNYGISENAGFILVTGEVGTGKTTIIRSMMKGLNSDIRLARINNTRVASEQLISMINEDFGLDVKGKDKTEMLSELTDFLIDQYANSRKTILIIDEAQNLSPDLLEEIRLLSNLETDKAKLLQIILVGQPEIMKVLSRPELRQLRQRISISCHLSPITLDETETYILHRLDVAGNKEAVYFHDGVIKAIHQFSRGIPRLINIACDFLMLSAFAEETKDISVDFAKDVIGEIETTHAYWQDEIAEKPEASAPAHDALQAVINRLEILEASRGNGDTTKVEREDVLIKISEMERIVDNVMSRLDADIVGLKKDSIGQIAHVSAEVDKLRERIAGIEDRQLSVKAMPIVKKKNFWGRVLW